MRGLCTAAGRNAFLRVVNETDVTPKVTAEDFSRALRKSFHENTFSVKQRKPATKKEYEEIIEAIKSSDVEKIRSIMKTGFDMDTFPILIP